MSDLELLRAGVEADYVDLQRMVARDAQVGAAILRGLLYVGKAIEELREDLHVERAVAEERHRDLLGALMDLQPGRLSTAPPGDDNPEVPGSEPWIIWNEQHGIEP